MSSACLMRGSPQNASRSGCASPASPSGSGEGSVVSQGLDQLRLGHGRATLDANLPGLLDQVLLAPVVVGAALAALAAHLAARTARGRVRDPRRLVLALAALAELLIRFLVLDLRPRHGGLLLSARLACF